MGIMADMRRLAGRRWQRDSNRSGSAKTPPDRSGTTTSESPAAPSGPYPHPHPLSLRERGEAVRVWFWLGRYRTVLASFCVAMFLFTLLRVSLLAVYTSLPALFPGTLARILFVGLRFDVMAALVFVLPQAMHMTFVSDRLAAGRLSRCLLVMEWIIGFTVLPFLCVCEFLFFEEFQSRLNYIAFEYLVYPHEVFGNIWESYPVVPLLAGIAAVAIALLVPLWRWTRPALEVPLPWRRRCGLLFGLLGTFAVLWLTTGMKSMTVSDNRVANECSGNGLYTFVSNAWTCQLDYPDFYLTIAPQEAQQRVRRLVAEPDDQFPAAGNNCLDRDVHSPLPPRDWNVVLILEESFGSDFVGVLGDDRGLTPCFDALTKEGMLFDNFYATGNRTARALEAVLTSLPPIPTEAILKRSHSQHVETLARILARRGYQTVFVYGGRGLFDGMRSFTMNNGFGRFIEQSDYEHPTFENAWGVCDEDIFHKTLAECDRMDASGKPFFVTIMTVSNHRPYTYPDGRIDRPSNEQRRENAVQYADWALGDFFARARQRDFSRDTLFVILGDHGARVYGSLLFPMKSYRIPALMIPPDGHGNGTRCHTLASSLDIAPTIMGLLGGTYRSVFFGRDVLALKPSQGYALMQHNHDLALLDARHRMVVLGLEKAVSGFRLDPQTWKLTHMHRPDPDMRNNIIALFQTAHHMYVSETYFPALGAGSESSPVTEPPLRPVIGSRPRETSGN